VCECGRKGIRLIYRQSVEALFETHQRTTCPLRARQVVLDRYF
jgi:hypothetical protein